MKAAKILTIIGVFVLALGAGTVSEAAGAKTADLNLRDGSSAGNLDLAGDRAVLYSQVASVATGYSWYADDTGDSYACEGADDFSVTWAEGWLVNQVHLVGIYYEWDGDPTDTASGAHINFYAGGSDHPTAAAVCSSEATVNTDMIPAPPATGGPGSHGDIVFDLNTPCNLPMGDYWLGMGVIIDYGGYAVDFRWTLQTSIVGNEPTWINPPGGWGAGTDWMTFTELFGSNSMDYSFEILGDEITGPTPTPPPGGGGGEPIPTMNAYGIFAMVGLLLGVAILVFIRRR